MCISNSRGMDWLNFHAFSFFLPSSSASALLVVRTDVSGRLMDGGAE